MEVGRGELALQTAVAVAVEQVHVLVKGHPIRVAGPLYSSADLKSLATDAGVRPWSFVQRLGDAGDFIPRGCPHRFATSATASKWRSISSRRRPRR